jgi:predicted RNA binding protein YcfA (HicA-like mRNA interferase family)
VGSRRAAEAKRYASSSDSAKQLIILHVKIRDVIRLLEEDGWYLARTKGSHRQFKHSAKSGAVTVAGKASIDVPAGTLNSILKQAGLKQERGSEK